MIASSGEVSVADLPPARLLNSTEGDSIDDLSLLDMERCTIAKALKKVNFNKAAASRMLGINIQRLNRRITRLGIQIPER